MPFGIGHPLPTHQMQSTCVWEGSRVPNLQTEFNYLDSFKSYGISSDFVVPIVPIAPMWSPCGPHGLWSPDVVPMVPTLSPSSPHHPHVIPIIPVIPISSP